MPCFKIQGHIEIKIFSSSKTVVIRTNYADALIKDWWNSDNFRIWGFTTYHGESVWEMLWVSMMSSAVLFEEFVSLIVVIGKSGVETCACMLGITDVEKRVEDTKSAEIKNTHDLFISIYIYIKLFNNY